MRLLAAASVIAGEEVMFGVGGTSPKSATTKFIWWLVFSLIVLFFLYVLTKN